MWGHWLLEKVVGGKRLSPGYGNGWNLKTKTERGVKREIETIMCLSFFPSLSLPHLSRCLQCVLFIPFFWTLFLSSFLPSKVNPLIFLSASLSLSLLSPWKAEAVVCRSPQRYLCREGISWPEALCRSVSWCRPSSLCSSCSVFY